MHAALVAVDSKGLKRAMSVKALLPGFAGGMLCMLAALIFQRWLATVFWGAAAVWVGYWYFRTLAAGLRAATDPARRAVALGKDIGILRKRP